MKKFLRLLIAVAAVLLLVGSWWVNLKPVTSSTEPTPTSSPAATQVPVAAQVPVQSEEPVPEPTEAPSLPEAQPQDCAYGGTWVVDVDRSDYAKLLEGFGTSFRDYGSQMILIPEKGVFSFSIGVTGYDGVFTMNGDTIRLYGQNQNDAEAFEEFTLQPVTEDDTTYLLLSINGYDIYWMIE